MSTPTVRSLFFTLEHILKPMPDNGTEAFAVLHYQGAPRREPFTPQIVPDNSNPLEEYKLVVSIWWEIIHIEWT